MASGIPGLIPAGDLPLEESSEEEVEGRTEARLGRLADDIRAWGNRLRQDCAAGPQHELDVRFSQPYFEDWCRWVDALERGGLAPVQRRGRQQVLDVAKLFAAMWISYMLRTDGDLNAVTKELIDCMRNT